MLEKIQNSDFLAEYSSDRKLDLKLIPWDEDPQYLGFSVLRKYPHDKGFKPAVTKTGKKDTVVLIRIGCILSESSDNKVPLLVTVSKHSQYKWNHFGINFEDKDAPTKESLEESELSKQPVTLEDNSRYLLIDPKKVFDKKNNQEISLRKVVDNIYQEHIETISGRKAVLFRAKLNTKSWFGSIGIPFLIRILKSILGVCGKEFSDNPHASLVGIYEPYPWTQIETKFPFFFPFFKSSHPVSTFNVVWISILSLYIWHRWLILTPINETFSLAIIVLLFILFEYLIPYLIMSFINALIWSRFKLDNLSLKF